MIRKSLFAILGGMAFATIFSLAVPANAACLGGCADRIGNYYFAGCTMYMLCWDPIVMEECVITGVDCFYIEGPAFAGGPNDV